MSRDPLINRLEHVELPQLCTPHYQHLMKQCLVNNAHRQSSWAAFWEKSSEDLKKYQRIYVFGGVCASMLMMAVFIKTTHDNQVISQVHAQELIESSYQDTYDNNHWLNQAKLTGNARMIQDYAQTQAKAFQPVALSSSVAFAMHHGESTQTQKPEFRVNVIPAQLINDSNRVSQRVELVQFTTEQGDVVTMGISRNNRNVQFVKIDTVDFVIHE